MRDLRDAVTAPGFETSGRLAASAVERLVAASARQRAALARMAGLTAVDVLALEHILAARELSPSGLAARLHLSSSGTSAVIGRLTRRQLVSRRADPGNRRRALIRPTEQAASVAGPVAALRAEINALAGELTASERATVAGFLLRLADVSDRLADRLALEAEAEARAAIAVAPPMLWG